MLNLREGDYPELSAPFESETKIKNQIKQKCITKEEEKSEKKGIEEKKVPPF